MNRRALLIAPLVLLPATALASEGKKKEGEGNPYLPIRTLTASAGRFDGSRALMTVDCGLDVPDPALRQAADLMMPRLRSAMLEALQGIAAGLSMGAAPNADMIAQSLQRIIDPMLGKPGARLLLGTVMVA